MSDKRELELKFEVSPEKASTFRARSQRHLGGTDGVRERLASVYFDTRKHVLNKHGLSLRIRSAGERRVQTVKGSDRAGSGLFDRPEWESDVAGDTPDLDAAAKTPVGKVISGRHAGDLQPVFATEVDRTVWTVATPTSEIEVALDEGRIAADGSAQPISELELELKRGSASDLFALARSLDHTGSLKIGVLTKSERGYRLASGKSDSFRKAEPIALERGMPAVDAVATILRACIRHFRLNEPLLIDTRAAEPLHQARVALRRLRSALSLFRPLLADTEYERMRRRLRVLAGVLGDARNLDVFLERAAEPEGPANHPELPLEDLRVRRAEAYDKVVEMLGSRRVRRLMIDLLAWVEDGRWREPADKKARARLAEPAEFLAARLLEKRRRRVRKQGRDLTGLDPDARHQVRIEAKKLRYASEFFVGMVPSKKDRRRHRDFVASLQALQGSLGDLNDLQTGREIAAALARSPEEGRPGETATPAAAILTPEDESRREAALLASAVEAHHLFAKAKPFWRNFA